MDDGCIAKESLKRSLKSKAITYSYNSGFADNNRDSGVDLVLRLRNLTTLADLLKSNLFNYG